MTPAAPLEVATLGGGCFWCLEAVFKRIDGVVSVTSGFSGGTKADPTYDEVCTGTTGHAEVVQVAFDPRRIDYAEILDVFWKSHDPTTLNRQGGDVGEQYRSVVFYDGKRQRRLAEESRAKAQAGRREPIVTEIRPRERFWQAEEYHQDYYDRNRSAGYCRMVISPKLRKLHLE
jgi:peptide-methionine (S)-S-oxide reductase